jgi:predicted glycoside hydrolase/deacetylase ChbG (UPF0249 family)
MTPSAVIVNADDLGMSREVNDATFELMSKGRISSATIMANAPATREAARRAATFPRCSFGVHLNLTQFEPLTGVAGARLLVDGRGQLTRANRRSWSSQARLGAAYQELCAQVERVARLGVRITHLDSHHHVHTAPGFFPVLKAIQRRYGIRSVRLTKNFYASDQRCSARLAWSKRAFNWALKSIYATTTTDRFTEFLTYINADAAATGAVDRIELMVHPGAPGAAEETTILEGDWTARVGRPVQLISYADLSTTRSISPRSAQLSKELRPCG